VRAPLALVGLAVVGLTLTATALPTLGCDTRRDERDRRYHCTETADDEPLLHDATLLFQ